MSLKASTIRATIRLFLLATSLDTLSVVDCGICPTVFSAREVLGVMLGTVGGRDVEYGSSEVVSTKVAPSGLVL